MTNRIIKQFFITKSQKKILNYAIFQTILNLHDMKRSVSLTKKPRKGNTR